MAKKIAIVGGAGAYARPFMEHGGLFMVASEADVYELKPDVLVFTGGADVDPYLYDEHPHYTTHYDTRRDAREAEIFHAGLDVGAKMCGICRGSQFLTVMNGGKLVQHIQGHGIHGTHDLFHPVTGARLTSITSTHHQMMYPFQLDDDSYEVLAVGPHATEEWQGVPVDGGHTSIDVVEAVYYPQTQALCVQGHPEYMPTDSEGWHWYQTKLVEFIFND